MLFKNLAIYCARITRPMFGLRSENALQFISLPIQYTPYVRATSRLRLHLNKCILCILVDAQHEPHVRLARHVRRPAIENRATARSDVQRGPQDRTQT